jgi:hypothetical protein
MYGRALSDFARPHSLFADFCTITPWLNWYCCVVNTLRHSLFEIVFPVQPRTQAADLEQRTAPAGGGGGGGDTCGDCARSGGGEPSPPKEKYFIVTLHS